MSQEKVDLGSGQARGADRGSGSACGLDPELGRVGSSPGGRTWVWVKTIGWS